MITIKKFCNVLMPLMLSLPLVSQADDSPGHYSGKPAQTLEQARVLLLQHNQELSALLKAESLSPVDLNTIHQLTYTLENALEKIANDVALAQTTLEALHKASETNAPQKVKALAKTYLEQSAPFQK